MIEVASHPPDLSAWDTTQDPFYLEVFGETQPLVDATAGELRPSCPTDADDRTAPSAPIYQYWWTIGHDGNPHALDEVWKNLDDEAAHVFLYFPLNKGWRIHELAATVTYLHPFREHTSLAARILDDVKNIAQPALADASALAGFVPMLAGAAPLLSTIAKLQVNAIPQVPGFEWSVSKVTTSWAGHGVVQGVMWRLPKKMFTDLGGRLTGSLALSFIPSPIQRDGDVLRAAPVFAPGAILAHAVVFGPFGPSKQPHWAPAQNTFVELRIAPRLPAAPPPPAR